MSEVSLPVPQYPSSEELFGPVELPQLLVAELRARYAEYGEEYRTDDKHDDGRSINACMTANSAQDAQEEITDAAFNLCVLRLKGFKVGHLLRRTQELWMDLERMKQVIADEAI